MNSKPLARLLLALTIVSLACNAPFLGQTGGGGRLETVAPVQALLTPDAYSETARALAEAIAELNRVQEQTLEHLRGTPTPETVDADLVQTAAAAMTVAQLAEQLAAAAASQAGGSEQAAAAAAPYIAAAQVGYLTVIESQNMREEYKQGGASAEQVSNMVGETGGMLWSGDHFDVSATPAPFAGARVNPASVPAPMALPPTGAQAVAAQVSQSSGKDTDLAAWSSSASGTRTIRIVVPAPRSLAAGNGLDPSLLDQMRRPEGQADADVVRVAAAAQLVGLGGTKVRGGLPSLAMLWPAALQEGFFVIEITVPAALVFQSQFGRVLPYFPDGESGVTATADVGGPLVSRVTVADGQPVVEPPLEVNTDQPLVALEITGAAPTGAADSDTRDVALTVSWNTTLADPAFTLICFTGSGESASTDVSGASGEAGLTLPFSLLRDTALCEAKAPGQATRLGRSQVIALPAAEGAAPAPSGGAVAYTGSFTLQQADAECNFSAAPATGGTLELAVDYAAGTASGTFSGAGEGVRTALECSGNFADLTWSQSYSGTFSGTVDASGSLNLTGTLNGSGTGTWSNCRDASDQPFECPADSSGPYSYPISVTGTISQAAGSGSGAIAVSNINLATGGSWSVP